MTKTVNDLLREMCEEVLDFERRTVGPEGPSQKLLDLAEQGLEQLRALEPDGDREIDRAYYNGARQAAAMAHQSLRAMDEWINAGCGGRGPTANRPAEPEAPRVCTVHGVTPIPAKDCPACNAVNREVKP